MIHVLDDDVSNDNNIIINDTSSQSMTLVKAGTKQEQRSVDGALNDSSRITNALKCLIGTSAADNKRNKINPVASRTQSRDSLKRHVSSLDNPPLTSTSVSQSSLQKLARFSKDSIMEIDGAQILSNIDFPSNIEPHDSTVEKVVSSSTYTKHQISASLRSETSPKTHPQKTSPPKTNKPTASLSKVTSSYTPLEKQVLELRKQSHGALLFVECGYKYRFFGKDAEVSFFIL